MGKEETNNNNNINISDNNTNNKNEGMKESGTIRFIAGAISAVSAETITLPVDTIKVRLQLQSSATQYIGTIGTIKNICKEEGFSSLWKGLTPALVRQSLYTSMMMALYEPTRNLISSAIDNPQSHQTNSLEDMKKEGIKQNNVTQQSSFWTKLLAGGAVGGICITLLNPIEIVKVRMQADQGGKLYQSGITKAFSEIIQKEGAFALWKGIIPNIQRAIIVNAAELGTYDQAKVYFIESFDICQKFEVLAHLNASFVAGFAGALASNPIDVTKTRLMNQRNFGGNEIKYRGMVDCFVKIVKNEGFPALYKGFLPNWMRKGPWCVVFFLVYEQIRFHLPPLLPFL